MIEKKFEYKGFPCVVVINPIGYRCGYVGIHESHHLYKKSKKLDNITCHGGITYQRSYLKGYPKEGCWWIGFDCAHWGDGFDYETVKEAFRDDKQALSFIERHHELGWYDITKGVPIKTLEFCENECKQIVEQLLISEKPEALSANSNDDELKEHIKLLMDAFPNSIINKNFEFVADIKTNQWFRLDDCKTPLDINCKVLEYLSRAAFKTYVYRNENSNRKYHQYMLDCINNFLDTDFTKDDINLIYTHLGNGCNHELCKEFVLSGYDMDILNR